VFARALGGGEMHDRGDVFGQRDELFGLVAPELLTLGAGDEQGVLILLATSAMLGAHRLDGFGEAGGAAGAGSELPGVFGFG